MVYYDFQIRAWQVDARHVQVIVHSSPVGDMRQPVTVDFDARQAEVLSQISDFESGGHTSTRIQVMELGRKLADILFPAPVSSLFDRSLERIKPEDGLRLRLCLDNALSDLRWEFLYRPDVLNPESTEGFLALNPRISLVRGAPTASLKLQPSKRKQRLVFAGVFWPGHDNDDDFRVREEFQKLTKAQEPVKEFIGFDFIDASDDHIQVALTTRPVALFHYAGHTDTRNGRGYLVRSARDRSLTNFDVLFSERLAPLLRQAGVMLAVFNGCNSSNRVFVEPLIRAGLPALVGVHGSVSSDTAITFCEKLYGALSIGLSLDEAVTWSRLHLLEVAGPAFLDWCEWGRFTVFMPSTEAVLFPRPVTPAVRQRQEIARREREETIINIITQNIGSVSGGGSVLALSRGFGDSPPPAVAAYPNAKLSERGAYNKKEALMATQRQYINFNLELRDLDVATDTFKVAVLPSPEVGETPDAVSVTYGYGELEGSLDRLDRKRLRQKDLISLGENLAKRLLPPGSVRELFQGAIRKAGHNGGVRLRLLIRSPKLAQLPWEFTYLPMHEGEKARKNFLVLNPHVSIVRHEALPEAHPTLAGASPERLRLVAATANVNGYRELQLDREKTVIEDALQGFSVDGVTIDWEPFLEDATMDDITVALAKGADLFHFAGHGVFTEQDRDPATGELVGQGHLALVQDKASKAPDLRPADELALQLQKAGVRVVVLGACESGRRDGVSAWTGIAPALVERGVPAVVAMQYEVLDDHAIAFSQMFYTSLASGLSIDEAVSAGRLAMLGKSREDDVEWGVPVLYMRSSDGVLFPKLAERNAETASQIRRVVQQTVETIKQGGKVIGIQAKWAHGSFEVTQKATTVEGELVGYQQQ